jgi:hypothetical protein
LKVDRCFKDLSGFKIIKLCISSYEKINLIFDKKLLTQIFENEDKFMAAIRNPKESDKHFKEFTVIQVASTLNK